MKFTLLLLIFLLSSIKISSDDIKDKEDNIPILSSSRKVVNTILGASVYSLDYIFSLGERRRVDSPSYVDFKVGPLYEKYTGLDYEWDSTGSMTLPNTKKKFKLFLRNLNDNDKSGFTDKSSDDKRSFVFGLQFAKKFFKYLYSGVSVGARFNSYYPDPLVSLSLKLSFNFWNSWNLTTGNSLYYFLEYQTDNNLFFDLSYLISSKTKLMSYNYYRYRQFLGLHEVKNGIGIYHIISKKLGINYEFEVLRKKDDLFSYDISYYYMGLNLKHIFHGDWLYYQIKPGFYFRKKNDFRFSPRILVYMGIVFRSR